MSNPYAGNEPYQSAWQHGYDYGAQHPQESQPEAPDFSSWEQDETVTGYLAQMWQEGALAGREAGATSPATSAAAGDSLDGGVGDASLPGGVSTPPPAQQETDLTQARVHTVKFWIHAFISPAHVDGPPGYGLAYNYEYFSGDNRGYSNYIHASYRLHSEVEISGLNTAQPHKTLEWHDCLESHALDKDLNIVDTKKAQPRAQFGEPTREDGKVSIHYAGAANMPLITGSPDIDANGTFSVDVMTGEVSFHGKIDSFPWFEGYAAVNNGAPVTLFNEDPTGDGPGSLFGDANRAVSGSANALGE
jgi:hypothetical protein